MGIGIVLFIYIVVIFLLSSIIALVWSILIKIFYKEDNRKKEIVFAVIAPFVALFTLFLCGLLGSTIVSKIKGVDEGIGDLWYVTIEDNCKLIFIDSYEQSFLDDENKTIIESIEKIEVKENNILGKTYNNRYC